jgi:hypothetical protein
MDTTQHSIQFLFIAYSLNLNPKTYLEIGSGNSTKFARESITNNQLGTKLISIDPNPRAEIDAICDQVVRTPVEDLPLTIFEDLVSGDILFVDNSHRASANSDVTVFFMDILPNLPPGVLVHLHDICLPWDYAEEQAEDAYSEQYLLATALLMGSKLKTRLPNLFVTRTPELISILSPIFDSIGNLQRERLFLLAFSRTRRDLIPLYLGCPSLIRTQDFVGCSSLRNAVL